MTRQQLEAENALLRETIIAFQFVRWLRLTTGGEPLRDACLRLAELERWAALAGCGFDARHAPHEAELPGVETVLSCSCGDRLAVSGGSSAAYLCAGYFRATHSGRKCRVEEVAV